MKLNSTFFLDLNSKTDVYYNLLLEEDFDFKSKDISLSIEKVTPDQLKVSIDVEKIIDLKIANSAFIKSLEIIEKSLNI